MGKSKLTSPYVSDPILSKTLSDIYTQLNILIDKTSLSTNRVDIPIGGVRAIRSITDDAYRIEARTEDGWVASPAQKAIGNKTYSKSPINIKASNINLVQSGVDAIKYTGSATKIIRNINDGNPVFQIGSSDADCIKITSFYKSGQRRLSVALFDTITSSTLANAGMYRFSIDGDKRFDLTDTEAEFEVPNYLGGVAGDTDTLILTNKCQSSSMTNTRTSILFNQQPYDTSVISPVDAAKITVGTEGNWTSTTGTQDAYMSFSTVLNGTMTERIRAKSDGLLFTIPGAEEDECKFTVGATNHFASFTGEDGNFSRFRMYEMGGETVADYFNILVEENGETTISTVDAAASAADLNFQIDGGIKFDTAIDKSVTFDFDNTKTTSGTVKGLDVDLDHTGIVASGQILNTMALNVALNTDSPTMVGGLNNYGIYNTVIGAASGTQRNHGIYNTVTGAGTNIGYTSFVTDGGTDITLVSSENIADYCTISTTTDGETTIATVEDGVGFTAHLNLDVDGNINLDSTSGNNLGLNIQFSGTTAARFEGHHSNTYFTMFENLGASENDMFRIACAAAGATTLSTVDQAGATANLTLDIDGDIFLEPFLGGPKIKESSVSAAVDTAGYGQIWVKDEDPCELYFTNDDGDDIQITDQANLHTRFSYETKVCNYFAQATGNYIPLAGYIIERTSTTSQNEYIAMVAPYDGKIVSFAWRSEIAQNGTLEFDIYESPDGVEVPGVFIGSKDTTLGGGAGIADDTAVLVSIGEVGMTSGTNSLTKGRIYAIKITNPSISYDTNCTVAFRWDVTT